MVQGYMTVAVVLAALQLSGRWGGRIYLRWRVDNPFACCIRRAAIAKCSVFPHV